MILVDSSVWIDYFRGTPSPEADRLDALLGNEALIAGDIIVAEVLQGFQTDTSFRIARELLERLPIMDLVGRKLAVEAALNFRRLRVRGITVRKTIDTLIATWCIANGASLLFSDRDFDPFVQYLGLQSAMAD